MTVFNLEDATLTPAGETRPLPLRKGQQRIYLYGEGCVFELEAVSSTTSVLAPSRPAKLLFGAISDPRVRIVIPIPVEIHSEDETVIAFSPDLEEYGYGRSMTEALEDFGKTVCELYFELASQESKLSDDLRIIRSKLHSYVKPRSLSA